MEDSKPNRESLIDEILTLQDKLNDLTTQAEIARYENLMLRVEVPDDEDNTLNCLSKLTQYMVKHRNRKIKLTPEFQTACEDIHELAMQRMHPLARKRYKQEKLEHLGAKPLPNTKIPYNILVGIKKKQKERESDAKEQQKILGYAEYKPVQRMFKKKDRKRARRAKFQGKALGKMKNGTLEFSKSDIRALTKK